MRSMIIAVAVLASASSVASGQEWTGLAYSPNHWPDGSVEGDLHDAKSYLRNGLTSTSVDMLKRVIARDPKKAEAYFWLSGAYRKLGEGAAARTALDKALQLDPSLRAHLGELNQFGPAVSVAKQLLPTARNGAARCDDLYATCTVSVNRCTMNGCTYDAGRAAACTAERNQCRIRNR